MFRKCVLAILVLILTASPAFAQGKSEEAKHKDRVGITKLVIGIAAAVQGVIVVVAPLGGTGKTIGAGLLGSGGYLIWSGMKDRDAARSMPSVGFVVNPKMVGVTYRRVW
jgi:hypothetical protein